jgi:hypothetical protein
VKVTGGSQAASQINGVNKALDMNAQSSQKSTTALDRNSQSQNKNSQQATKTTRSLRGLTFGLTGLVSSGVEAIGMWGIYQDAQTRVNEATRDLAEATRTYGEDSTQAAKATDEVTQAERALNMVRRNTILSGFDMVTWITLTVNGLARLRQGTQLQNTVQNALTATNVRATAGMGAFTAATNIQTAATTKLGSAMNLLVTKLGPIALILGGIVLVAKAWADNWGGFGDAINKIGVSIGNAVPQLKGFLDILKKVGLSINALVSDPVNAASKIGAIWAGTAEAMTSSNEELTKSIEELNKSSAEFIQNLASMDKKEMKSSFFDMGIKGGASKRMRELMKDFNQLQERITGFGNAMQTIRQVNVLEKFGFDVPESLTKKIMFTFEDRFNDISKMFAKGSEGRSIFEGLADAVEDAAKADPSKVPQIIANYLANHDEIIKMLEAMGFDEEAAFLKTQADEAMKDWWKTVPKNTNPVTKAKLDASQLPKSFTDQFPSTFPKDTEVKKLPPLQQDVTVNLLGAARGGGTSNITDIPGWIADFLSKNLFNAGKWHDAIMIHMPTIADGIMTDIWNSFVSWIGINNIQPLIDANNTANNIIQGFIDSLFQKAEGAGPTTPTPQNTNADKPPATQDWVTWQTSTEEKIGFVWIKATAFVNYINTSFTSTIPTALQTTTIGFGDLANFAVSTFNTIVSSSAVTVNSTESNFAAMHQAITKLMSDLASHWSKMCNSMIANAKSAADGIIKQLNRIPTKITTIHEIKTKEVAAASGFQGVVSSPTRFLVGEGGKPEFVSVTPMSQFGGTNQMTTTVHKSKPTSESNTKPPIVNNYVYLDGVELRHVLSHQLAKNQSAFK